MVKIGEIAISRERSTEGVWVPIAQFPGLEFRVRRWNQGAYDRFCRDHIGRAWDSDQLDRAFCGAWLVTAVKGLEDDAGEPIVWGEDPEHDLEFFLPRYPVDDEDDGEGIAWVYKNDAVFGPISNVCQANAIYMESVSGNS